MNKDAFNIGYDAGFKAGIKGDLIIPSANPITAEANQNFSRTLLLGQHLVLNEASIAEKTWNVAPMHKLMNVSWNRT